METKWNDDEEDALRGLSLLAQLTYLRVFRRRMDYLSGIAGVRTRITYQTICDAVGFSPDPGSKARRWLPTKGEVRAAIAELERVLPDHGRPVPLLVDVGSCPHRGYQKQLPLASLDQSAQKGNDAGTTQEQHTRNVAQNDAGATHGLAAVASACAPTEVCEQRMEQRSSATPTPPRNSTPPESGIRRRRRGAKAPVELAEFDLAPPSLSLVASAPSSPSPAEDVFTYWRERTGHSRAKLDTKRRKAIAARLKDGYRVDDLKAAVDGCCKSPWHQGQNNQGRKYDDIELICRNASKVDQFVALNERLSGIDSEQAQLDAWLNEDSVIEGVCSHV